MKWFQNPFRHKHIYHRLCLHCLFVGGSFSMSATLAYADDLVATSKPVLEASSPSTQQLKSLDIEIILLKAELAQQKGNPNEVSGYLKQLGDLNKLPDSLQSRVQTLQAYLGQQPEKEVSVPFQYDEKNILVLLPMAGEYGVAGQNILKGIQSALPGRKLTVIDTSIYDNALELWSLTKLYQPSFVFGPLQKSLVNGMADLNHDVPMLMLNHPKSPIMGKNIKVLSPSRQQDLASLFQKLQDQDYQKILFLVGKDAADQTLWATLNQDWLQPKHLLTDTSPTADFDKSPAESQTEVVPFEATPMTVKGSVDQAISSALNIPKSLVRQNWLKKTIGQSLQVMPRARQDYDAVVALLPFRQAMQVAPLMSFYHLNLMDVIWFPAKLPSKARFLHALPFWQSTQAILPAFQINHWQLEASDVQSSLKSPENKVGIFYALGNAAVQVSVSFSQGKVRQWKTALGQVILNEHNKLVIQPQFYELDQNQIIPLVR